MFKSVHSAYCFLIEFAFLSSQICVRIVVVVVAVLLLRTFWIPLERKRDVDKNWTDKVFWGQCHNKNFFRRTKEETQAGLLKSSGLRSAGQSPETYGFHAVDFYCL